MRPLYHFFYTVQITQIYFIQSIQKKIIIDKKKRQPISRVLSFSCRKKKFYHLSRAFVTKSLNQPTPRQRTSRSLTAGIFGLSTHKVYPQDVSLLLGVSSYLTFSPLLFIKKQRLFSVALSVTSLFKKHLPVRKYGGSVLPGLSSDCSHNRRQNSCRFRFAKLHFFFDIQ